MSKKEYLDSLREFLSYELPSRMVEKNISFYANYFAEQEKLGKSFQEVEAELGEPQLIARTCIDAAKSGADGIPNSGDDLDFSEEIERESSASAKAGSNAGNTNQGTQGKHDSFRVVSGMGCLIPILILVVLLVVLISFFATPIGSTILIGLVVAGIISMLVRLFKR